jgi:hypothetical protein
MGERWPEAIRRRKGAEALRRYAALLAEHERVRRLVEESAADPEATVAPSGAAWKPLREVALFQGADQRAAALRAFCSEFVVPVEPRTGGGAAEPVDAELAAGGEEGEGKEQRAKGKGQREEGETPESKGRTAAEGMSDGSSRGLPRPREGKEETAENTLPRAPKPAGGRTMPPVRLRAPRGCAP